MSIQALSSFGAQSIAIDFGGVALGSAASYNTSVLVYDIASLKNLAVSGVNGSTSLGSVTIAGLQTYLIKVVARPATTARYIIGNASCVGVKLNPNGTLGLLNAGGLTGTSSTALTDTTAVYEIGIVAATGVNITQLYINGVLEVDDQTPSSQNQPNVIGPADTIADTYEVYFGLMVFDNATLQAGVRGKWLGPASDSSVGAGWTDSGGGTTNLYQSIDNTPPTGIADTTSNAGHQIRNASNANSYALNLSTYTAVGIDAGATINAVLPYILTGAPVSTGAKTGTLALTNPTMAATAFAAGGVTGAFWSGTAAGTFPTGWKFTKYGVVSGAGVALGTAPVATVAISGGTNSRIAMVCAVGMYVLYTPAVVSGYPALQPRAAFGLLGVM